MIRMHIGKELFDVRKAVLALCIILCALGVLPRFHVYGSPSTIPVGPMDSIQVAINLAAPGDTILVSAGVYNESLLVTKPVSLIGAGMDTTIINGQNGQSTIEVAANDVVIEGFTIESAFEPTYGININSKGNETISDNRVQGSSQGISLSFSTSNTVMDNVVFNNTAAGITVYESSGNVFYRNIVENNPQGMNVIDSTSNDFIGNTFQGNLNPNGAESVARAYDNNFTDNNFLDGVSVVNSGSNSWNSTTEGNFWPDYNGSNSGDGTGDVPYNGTQGVIDYHPLMGQFTNYEATLGAGTYQIYVISNSTVSNFKFQIGTETGNKIISFSAVGPEGTSGFARLMIPADLMGSSVTVLVGGIQITPLLLNTQNTASNYLYFTYVHSNQSVLIISSLTLDMYNQLLQQFIELNSAYNKLLANYTAQVGIINNDTTQFNNLGYFTSELNSTYQQVLSNYANLLGNYSQLQQKYQDLNSSYQQHLTDENQNLQNVRNLMYIFAAATAVLIIATVYFSRRTYLRPAETRSTQEPTLI